MKDKVLIFIIGLLLGAVLTASGFLIYEKNYQNNFQFPNGERFEMMPMPDGKEPPEKPEDKENGPELPFKDGMKKIKSEENNNE